MGKRDDHGQAAVGEARRRFGPRPFDTDYDKYWLCNCFDPDAIEQACAALGPGGDSPRILILTGEAGSGRQYFAEAVVYELNRVKST